MKLSQFFGMSALIVAMGLAACEVSIKDGKVPDKYLTAAKEYAGTFRGEFEGLQSNLTLSLANDGTAALTIVDLYGNKNFIKGCSSQIGTLRYADVDKNDQQLKSAKFKFSTSCPIEGRLVELYFNSKNDVSVSIVKETQIQTDYGPDNCYYAGPYTGPICTPTTTTKVVPYSWLSGRFSR